MAGIFAPDTRTKLDDLGPPDDNRDLNATALRHGLLPKLSGTATTFLSGAGTWLSAGSSSSPLSVEDASFNIYDNLDPTKLGMFQLSGLTSGATRTLTWPDSDGTITLLAFAQALTNKTYNNVTLTAPATTATLTLAEQTTLITTGTVGKSYTLALPINSRTFTFPDASDTMVNLSSIQTLSNKVLGVSNTVTLLDDLFLLRYFADTTKSFAFDLSRYPTGTAVTLAIPAYALTNVPVMPIDEGTSGYVLVSQGSSVAPIWQSVSTTVDVARTWTSLQTFPDNTFKIVGSASANRTLVFEVDAASANADCIINWAGTADRTITLPDATTTLAGYSDKLSVFAATTSAQLAGVISDETGSGALVFATSPTLVTPLLGTPTSGTLTNCTGLPITGLASGTSANLASVLSDETGAGLVVFSDNPTFRDSSDTTKTMPLTLASMTAGKALTLDMRSAFTRSLIFNLTGASGAASNLTIQWAGTAARTFILPAATSTATIIVNNLAQTLSSKTLDNSCTIAADITYQPLDTAFAIQGAASTFLLTHNLDSYSANRTTYYPNVSGLLAEVGNTADTTGADAAAGDMNKVNLTNKAGAITTKKIANGTPAGMYLIEAILQDTTADVTATGVVTLTIAWTDDIGATTDATTTIALNAIGRAKLTLPLYLASGDITYATGIVGTVGAARYACRIRCTYLG